MRQSWVDFMLEDGLDGSIEDDDDFEEDDTMAFSDNNTDEKDEEDRNHEEADLEADDDVELDDETLFGVNDSLSAFSPVTRSSEILGRIPIEEKGHAVRRSARLLKEPSPPLGSIWCPNASSNCPVRRSSRVMTRS